ncbi:MAG: hypothetical protein WC860_02335 [Candidatus Margulisiibacteriota bacterium]|jgi:hypothetical protein
MIKFIKSSIFLFVILFGISNIIFAENYDTFFTSMRQIGMGGTAVAIPNDINTLYQNPAGLANIQNFNFNLLTAGIEINSDYISKFSTISRLNGNKDTDSITGIIKDLAPARLTSYSMLQALGFGWNGFGFGFFARGKAGLNLYRPIDPYISVNSIADTAGMIGFAPQFNIGGFKFALGATAKYMARSILYNNRTGDENLTYGLSNIVDVVKNSKLPTDSSYCTTQGPGFDVGGLATFESFIGPKTSIGFTVKNILTQLRGVKTINGVNQSTLVTVPLGVIVGIGTSLRLPPGVIFDNCTLAIDYDAVSQYQSIFKKFHAGIEGATMGDFMKIRLGLNQGFVVGGVGLKLWFFHLDYAYNQESLGNGTGVGLNDNSYHALSLGIAI